MKLLLLTLNILILQFCMAQSDTLNRVDENGRKQGYWIIYGKDRASSGYPSEGKIEEGSYIDSRKEGKWIKYENNGVTIRLKATYHNNRPMGTYIRHGGGSRVPEKGTFNSKSSEEGVVIEQSNCSHQRNEDY